MLERGARAVGAVIYRGLSAERRLRQLTYHEPTRRLRPRTLVAACVQRHVLDADALGHARPDDALIEQALRPADYVGELEEALEAIGYMPLGVLNTEALVLWALIRRARPDDYLESGTGRGYSAALGAQALARNGNGRLVTFGVDEPGIVETARNTLSGLATVTYVEQPSEQGLPRYLPTADSRLAIFIDGPKGSSPEFVQLVERIVEESRPLFIAVHDCEAHLPRGFDPGGKWPLGRINPTRAQLEWLYSARGLERDYVLAFMDNDWCTRHERLNEPVYRHEDSLGPFRFKGSRQVSHSPVIGVLLSRALLAELEQPAGAPQAEHGAR